MLLITVLLNYGTLAKLILAKLASKNRMPCFMRPGVTPWKIINNIIRGKVVASPKFELW